MNRSFMAGLLLALILAVVLRCPHLELRPMHNDEAVNAVKFGELWEHGVFNYDPNEHHGPSLFYATLAIAKLTTSPDFEHLTETKLRLVTVLFGIGLIIFLPLVTDGIGKRGVIWAAFFTALSPAMVFYSRYYIHEMLLTFFAFLGIGAGWRYWRSRRIEWALLAGGAVGLMHATKETFVITLMAAGLALGLNQIWNRFLDASGLPVKAPRIRFAHVWAGLAVWALVAIVLFSSFFSNTNGVADSVRTYKAWIGRAGGDSPHIHPWYFYLHRLFFFHVSKGPVWSEALIIVLAAIGGMAGFARKGIADANASFVRFIALYTVILAGAYGVIAYKTPWCLLSFWHGAILLAGVGAVVLVHTTRFEIARIGMGLLLGACSVQLAAQAWQASGRYASERSNPYVYAQTSPDILNLVEKVEAFASVHPQHHQMVVKVMAPESEYWPLPWYLRGFKRTGWWGEIPADPYAPVMIVSSKFRAGLDERKTHLMVQIVQLRPEEFFEIYVELDLWRAYLAKTQASLNP